MKLIVGLGNPGKEYVRTRHNVGFLVVDELARRLGIEMKMKKTAEAEVGDVLIDGEKIVLCKPQTFMNLSGRAVAAVARTHNVSAADILVVYDEADLPLGTIRYRAEGSSGGHNGMQSILESFPKESAIARVRVGIGRSENAEIPLDAWVLGSWTAAEKDAVERMVALAADEIQKHT